MDNDVLQINNYEMEDMSGYLNGLTNETTTVNDDSKKEFTPLVEAQLFSDGMKDIGDKMDRITRKLDSMEKVILNNTNAIGALENKLKNEASSIQIPKGYEVNGMAATTSFNRETLNKNDGISVNEGVIGTEAALQTEENIAKQKLEDISGDVTEARELNFNNVTSQEKLKDISGDETKAQNLNFRNVVSGENLNAINVNTPLNNEVDFNFNVNDRAQQEKGNYVYDDGLREKPEILEEGDQ